MKKIPIAIFVWASTGAAFAQSSVTLSGVVDLGYTYGKSEIASKSGLTSGNNSTSRLIFRGSEDLSGGLAASFWLEAGINADSGAGIAANTNNQASGAGPANAGGQGLTFNRRSTLSLSGGWGELRLGQDFTPHYWNITLFDPFASVGIGANQLNPSSVGGLTRVRASNSIGYFLPNSLGGIYGQAMYFMGENSSNASNPSDGTGTSVRLGYAAGAFNGAVSHARTTYLAGNVATTNAAGSYDLGMVKMTVAWNRDRVSSPTPVSSTGFLVGATARVGTGEIKGSLSTVTRDTTGSHRTDKAALGYVHHISKRTAAYTTIARLNNRGGASMALGGAPSVVDGKSTGFDVGLRHTF